MPSAGGIFEQQIDEQIQLLNQANQLPNALAQPAAPPPLPQLAFRRLRQLVLSAVRGLLDLDIGALLIASADSYAYFELTCCNFS